MNGIAPELIRRTRSEASVDDLALTFVEEEVGRFDFANNWPKVKERGNIRERVAQWLDRLNVEANPDDVISAIDQLATSRPGRWR